MRALAGTLLALAIAAASLLAWNARLPEVDVRTWRWTMLGQVSAEAPVGQILACRYDGLHRVDLAISEPNGCSPTDLELRVLAGGPAGEPLRRVAGRSFEPGERGGWVRFEFEPIADSGGRPLCLQLAPSSGAERVAVTPWVRFRGLAREGVRWGERTFGGPLLEGRLLSQHTNLRGVAFSGNDLEGRYTLALLDPLTDRELVRAEAVVPARTDWGYVLFGFEALRDSRWRELGFRLSVPEGARLAGTDEGPGRVLFYGSGAADPRLVGMTHGAQLHRDRDLLVRAWTRRGPVLALSLLHERMGWRLAVLSLVWLAAVAALCLALPRVRAG